MSTLVGVILIVFFYAMILCLGFWSARKFKLISSKITVDDVMLANRSIGLVIGTFTMTATWVGGNFIAGTAEVLNSPAGLIWCQAPLGYALSLLIGGRFFVSKMRNSGYRTMMDPFLWKYGDIMHCLLYLPALVGDITWSAGILNALGSSLEVVLHLKTEIAITLSAAFACCYTLLGGMYAIAYTDVLQVICLSFGLWLCLPFILTNEHIVPITKNTDWVGELTIKEVPNYLDTLFLIIFGGLPWQVYWQRVLAAKSAIIAKKLCYIGAVGCVVMAVPAILIGAAASNAHWNETDYKLQALTHDDTTNTLPLAMLHFCPPIITFVGLGAIAAGVMSSTDSCLLSSSGIMARNIVGLGYFRIFKEKLPQPIQISVMRVALVINTCLSCGLALSVESTYNLWVLSSDMVYVVLFPQFFCVMFVRKSNAYGSLVSFLAGLTLRLLGGEHMLNIPAAIRYPGYDDDRHKQLFPFKTFSMLISLICLIGVSYVTDFLFSKQYLPSSCDFYGCFQKLDTGEYDMVSVKDNLETLLIARDRGSVARQGRGSTASKNDSGEKTHANVQEAEKSSVSSKATSVLHKAASLTTKLTRQLSNTTQYGTPL